jgi:hypothetical protein
MDGPDAPGAFRVLRRIYLEYFVIFNGGESCNVSDVILVSRGSDDVKRDSGVTWFG